MPSFAALASAVGLALLVPAALSGPADPAPSSAGGKLTQSAAQRGGIGSGVAGTGHPAGDGTAALPSLRAVAAPRVGWTWPVSPRPPVLRRFAVGPHRWSPGHRGVDLGTGAGAAVLAPASGVVTFAGPVAGRPVLVIAHDGGVRTSYEPVVASVGVGAAVARGQPVGRMARAGGHCVGSVCLHWGARRGEAYIDPLTLLQRPPIVLLPLDRSG